ncbi:MAG TPA: cell division protein FtsZ [Succinivibrionaceae bacterium]|nr:cell division protein FtsZ [Succinivibrionaceae bacterium]
MSDFEKESNVNTPMPKAILPSAACKIRVIGVGGGGGNSLQHMINQGVTGVDFIAINTDAQALSRSTAPLKVQIGVKLTNGLGSGCDPNKGRKAAEESREDIKRLLSGSDMVFITSGMGGGTGTGATPIIAQIAKETGALTIAVVTKPFEFEGKRHVINAESGISELAKHVDSIIVIDNEKLLSNLGSNISIVNAFNQANDVLLNAVRGITGSITDPDAFINLDFADVVTVMRGRGHAMIGTGIGQGANFVEDAVERAIHSPLIETVDFSSAAGVLVYARVNQNFPINKWNQVCNAVQAYADEEADCKFGMKFDESIAEDQIELTILITGISSTCASYSNYQDVQSLPR